MDTCAEQGIQVFGVTKGACDIPQVASAMIRGGVNGIGESRFRNIQRLRDSGIDWPIMLLRSPPLSRVNLLCLGKLVDEGDSLMIFRRFSLGSNPDDSHSIGCYLAR